MFQKLDHGRGSDKLPAQHKGGLVSVAWEKSVSGHGSDTA